MSADEWDADDFEPVAPTLKSTDKWDGEDEGEDVKDNWEDEDKKEEDGEEMKAVQRKKKKPLAERIAEKEAARLAAEQKEKEENKVLSKEERSAESERQKKMQEAADLNLAKEAFGVGEATGIDAMFPVTEEEFSKFTDALKTKISHFNTSKHYGAFIEKLMQELLTDVSVEDLRKINSITNSMFHEKQKLQKENEKKSKKKKAGKAVVMERDTDFGDIAAAGRGDYDDSFYDEDFI